MKLWLMFIMAGIVLSGCKPVSTDDIKIQTQANPKTSFSEFKTYAWYGSSTIVNDPYGQWNPPSFDTDAEIKGLIARQLSNRGMVEVQSKPDLLVGFSVGVNIPLYQIKMNPEAKMSILENMSNGGLMVVLMDTKSGYVNWAAMATAKVQKNPSSATVKKRLEYAVTGMFKELPK